MKKYILLLCLQFIAVGVFAQKIWHDPSKSLINPLEGQYFQNEERDGFYHRMPLRFKDEVREPVWHLSTNTAGILVRFKSNSKNIQVRYTLSSPNYVLPHMPSTGCRGVDLYVEAPDGEYFRVVGKYAFADTVKYTYNTIDYRNESQEYVYQLHLPPYNSVTWLEIGVDKDTNFEFIAPREEKPIVVYGTSIAQGACASRPGMIWSSILGRKLNRPVYNYGFSGNGRLEPALIDMIAEIDAAVYILDCVPNLAILGLDVLEDHICEQVQRLRQLRPNTPILMVDHMGSSLETSNKKVKSEQDRLELINEAAYKRLRKEGVKNIYHLDKTKLAIPHEAIVDYVHPSDLGMQIYADAYYKKLKRIIK